MRPADFYAAVCYEAPTRRAEHMQTAADALTLQFLNWVSERPRTYGDAMDRWRTSCPRLSIWEDAILDGLVRLENRAGTPRDQSAVALTPRGRALLDAH